MGDKALPQFRPGEMIIELRPEMVGKANPLGLATSIIELLAMLKSQHGAIKIETLWPVGVSVLDAGGSLARLVLPRLLKKLPANLRLTAETLLASTELGAPVDPELAREARLRLRIKLPPGEDVETVMKKVVANAGVEYVEPIPYMWAPAIDRRDRAAMEAKFPLDLHPGLKVVPDEGFFPQERIGRPSNWDTLELRNIAVLDSGCDEDHPGLADAVDYPNKESRKDKYGHGTFVSQIIAGRATTATEKLGLNPKTVYDTPAGVLPSARLWVADVMDSEPFDEGEGAKQYSLDPGKLSRELNRLAKRGTKRMREIDVVNLSLGSAHSSSTLKKDIDAVADAGILVVAAAGNSASKDDRDPVIYPAAFENCISVGALAFFGGGKEIWERTNNRIPDKTNRKEPWDICAPGEWILSGLPMNENAMGLTFSGWLSGTSMAAPYVTAAVAVLCNRKIKDRKNVLAELRKRGKWEDYYFRLKCPAAD